MRLLFSLSLSTRLELRFFLLAGMVAVVTSLAAVGAVAHARVASRRARRAASSNAARAGASTSAYGNMPDRALSHASPLFTL